MDFSDPTVLDATLLSTNVTWERDPTAYKWPLSVSSSMHTFSAQNGISTCSVLGKEGGREGGRKGGREGGREGEKEGRNREREQEREAKYICIHCMDSATVYYMLCALYISQYKSSIEEV